MRCQIGASLNDTVGAIGALWLREDS